MKSKIFIGTVIIFFTITSINAYWVFNETHTAFQSVSNDSDSNLSSNATDLNTLVIQGASSLIKSRANFLLLLNKLELSNLNGLNFDDLKNDLNHSIQDLENAYEFYYRLKAVADSTPYNQSIIESLKIFDYSGFQKEKELAPNSFDLVTMYLSSGDIRGIYSYYFHEIGSLLSNLYQLRWLLSFNTFPELENVWRINQKYMNALLLGQYTAEVFYNIKEGH